MATQVAEVPFEPSEFGGMFSSKVTACDGLPCSLYFADEMTGIPDSARNVLKIIHEELLGNSLGQKIGCYGAGDGPIHIMYLGPSSLSVPLNLSSLLDMLHLSQEYRSYNWMTTVDPMHQQMFAKVCAGYEDAVPTLLSLDAVMEVVSTKIPTRSLVPNLPPHVVSNYPCLEEGKLLFLLPRFENMHDGECLANSQCCPVAAAFQRTANGEYWYQFQGRTGANASIILETTQDGRTMNSGDIQESPVLAIFQTVAGDVFALAQWDYRD